MAEKTRSKCAKWSAYTVCFRSINPALGLLESVCSCGPITPTSLVDMLVTCDREIGSGRGGEGGERRSRNRQC